MNVISIKNHFVQPMEEYPDVDVSPLDLQEELFSGLSMYWSTAERIFQGSGIKLLSAPDGFYSLGENFFSTLFLYSYHRANIPRHRRILYVAVNQCLRGMVTGCDNILDDEYKRTLETDLPQQGFRFRSVLDIMVSDRVLFEILLKFWQKQELSYDQVLSASSESLRALTRSGAQEASEEDGIDKILEPSAVLRSVHHYKTGILFQCPWAVPLIIEPIEKRSVSFLLQALYHIGMGCQIMDDMVDLYADLKKKRHNYVVSLIFHGSDRAEQHRLQTLMTSTPQPGEKSNLLHNLPGAKRRAKMAARGFLESGLKVLFPEQYRFSVETAISFMARRIGAEGFMYGTKT
jgi:hypothetical protein